MELLGGIVGDMLGGAFEKSSVRSSKIVLGEKGLVTGCNTLMTAAVCDLLYYCPTPAKGRIERAIRTRESVDMLKKYGRLYPEMLDDVRSKWINQRRHEHCIAQADFSAVFCTGCAYAYSTLDEVLSQTELFCSYICESEQSIQCAKAVTSAVYALQKGADKADVAEHTVGLDIDPAADRDELSETLSLKRTTESAVRAAFEAFQRSYDFDSAVRFAVSYGAMSSVTAAAAGALAGAFYGVPNDLAEKCRAKLDTALRLPLERFEEKYCQLT